MTAGDSFSFSFSCCFCDNRSLVLFGCLFFTMQFVLTPRVFALWNHQGNLLRAIEYKKQLFVTSTLSVCGNFVFTATANGVILVFNAFSGLSDNEFRMTMAV
jgi:hypothetical protein